MFKNRKLEVRMVNTNKAESTTPAESDISLEGKLAIAGYYVERAIEKAGKAALAYVAVDTLRQVIVARALKR